MWQIVEDEQYNGLYSAKSGQIDHSQSTTLEVTLDVVYIAAKLAPSLK